MTVIVAFSAEGISNFTTDLFLTLDQHHGRPTHLFDEMRMHPDIRTFLDV